MAQAALTEDQMREALALVAEHGSVSAAARAINMSRETFRNRVDRAKVAGIVFGEKQEDARKGWSPEHDMTHTVPDGYRVKGVSTLYGKDGGVSAQWVKSTTDHDRLRELLMIAAQEMADKIPAEAPVPQSLTATRADLLNCYVITDYHLGALAWGEETGAAWDLQIAEDLLVAWFGEAIAVSPASSRAVFAQLGDFMHFDGLHAVTPTSGHVLDADTRFQKLVRVAIRVVRRVVSMLLTKHDHITLLMAEGNHDIASSAWLRELFAALYEQEPRVTVETRPDPYYCVEFGATSVFFHHGHLKKFDSVETALVGKFREVFGRTKYSYAHTGHLHHNVSRETNTMTIEQHRTLAAPDSHASRGGWLSGRDAKVITYSSKFGEVSRQIVSAAMVESRAA